MDVTEFQPLNPCVFQDEVFVVEPEATLEPIDEGDDAQRIVTASSPVNNGYE